MEEFPKPCHPPIIMHIFTGTGLAILPCGKKQNTLTPHKKHRHLACDASTHTQAQWLLKTQQPVDTPHLFDPADRVLCTGSLSK